MKQEIELKEGMTARIEGGKVIIETPEFCPKGGNFYRTKNGNIFILKNITGCRVSSFVFYESLRRVADIDIVYSCDINDIDGTATESEKQALLDALEKEGKRWNAEKKCVEPLPRWRAEKWERYYFLKMIDGKPFTISNIERNGDTDNALFELGNYFKTESELPVDEFKRMYTEFFANYKNQTK